MSGLQLSLFPTVVVPAVPAGAASQPIPGARGPAIGGESDSLLEFLPRRIPADGAVVLASLLGTPIQCRLRRSDRARRLRFVVDRTGHLTVVVPRRFPMAEVPPALEEQARWIVRTVERARTRAPRPRIEEGREVRLFGVPHVVRATVGDSAGESARVWMEGSEIVVRVPPLHPRTALEILRGWLRDRAARVIRARVQELNEPLGFALRRVTIRDQRTKWGACSATGSVSINWRLALAPPEVLEYVILHELCHLRELNHSTRFWSLLSAVRPGYERQRAWLKENGEELDL